MIQKIFMKKKYLEKSTEINFFEFLYEKNKNRKSIPLDYDEIQKYKLLLHYNTDQC